ncbi:hypothetical protein [Acinetobacter indicus]|uniref:hypothetical protein n=1 Tax=Acinetobacter indicus TaxID=756892 RepID=UPI000FD9AED3|nr:hypothetical protein [Acinetobacter indicus]RVT36871.1 hypothetical protein ENC20_04045 [Acinetobacter indicus]
MDLQKAREKFAEINLKHGFYTQEELKFTDLGVFECTAAEQDFDMWWECLIYYAQPLIDQKEKALLEQFEINNKLVEQVEKLKAQAVPEVVTIGNELQSWVAVHSFAAKDGNDIVCAVDANALAEEIEKLTGANA